MELIKKLNKIIIIDYAHTPDALKKTIKEVRNFFKKEVNLVFGCGGDRDQQKEKLWEKLLINYAKKSILLRQSKTRRSKKIINEIKKGCPMLTVILDRKEAIKKAIHSLKEESFAYSRQGA